MLVTSLPVFLRAFYCSEGLLEKPVRWIKRESDY
jgi:hypothetical protein